jgi:hypothetical protein
MKEYRYTVKVRAQDQAQANGILSELLDSGEDHIEWNIQEITGECYYCGRNEWIDYAEDGYGGRYFYCHRHEAETLKALEEEEYIDVMRSHS